MPDALLDDEGFVYIKSKSEISQAAEIGQYFGNYENVTDAAQMNLEDIKKRKVKKWRAVMQTLFLEVYYILLKKYLKFCQQILFSFFIF